MNGHVKSSKNLVLKIICNNTDNKDTVRLEVSVYDLLRM